MGSTKNFRWTRFLPGMLATVSAAKPAVSKFSCFFFRFFLFFNSVNDTSMILLSMILLSMILLSMICQWYSCQWCVNDTPVTPYSDTSHEKFRTVTFTRSFAPIPNAPCWCRVTWSRVWSAAMWPENINNLTSKWVTFWYSRGLNFSLLVFFITVLSRGICSLFGPTRKSSPWGNFSDGGFNQSINQSIKIDNKFPQRWWKHFALGPFDWLIDWW